LEQRSQHQEITQLVNRMERSRDIGIGKEVTGAAEIGKGELLKEAV